MNIRGIFIILGIFFMILGIISICFTIYSFVHYHNEVQSHILSTLAKISDKKYSFTDKNDIVYSGSTTEEGRGGYQTIYYVKENPSQNSFTSTRMLEKYIKDHYVKNTWKIVGIIFIFITIIIWFIAITIIIWNLPIQDTDDSQNKQERTSLLPNKII